MARSEQRGKNWRARTECTLIKVTVRLNVILLRFWNLVFDLLEVSCKNQ